jgi:hypothetical protein
MKPPVSAGGFFFCAKDGIGLRRSVALYLKTALSARMLEA